MERKRQRPLNTLRLALTRLMLYGTLTLVSGCLGMPEQVQPVNNFDLDRYLGQWYEIARLNHSFERGLDQVTATYSPRDDGGVMVINKGRCSTWRVALMQYSTASLPEQRKTHFPWSNSSKDNISSAESSTAVLE